MHAMPAAPRARGPLVIALTIATTLSLGCESERKIISIRGGLSGIRGAQGQDLAESERIDRPRSAAYSDLAAQQRDQANRDAEAADQQSLRITHDDGQITLIMTSPRHVVMHLRQTLTQNEPELLFDQVLSGRAKSVYAEQGLDPHAAVDFLFENRLDVLKMLQRMPQGEFTPGMFLKKIGPSAYRLELSGANGQGLRLRHLDVVWEQGVCRLLSIG